MIIATTEISLIRMFYDGPEVSLKGSPTVSPVTEAIHLLVMTHDYSTMVTRDGNVIGILRLSDVFEEVADIIRCCAEATEDGHDCEHCFDGN